MKPLGVLMILVGAFLMYVAIKAPQPVAPPPVTS